MSSAAFQSTVNILSGFGVPGELWSDAPHIAESFILSSVSAAYNIIGATAYTIASQGVAQAGSAGADGFAGILSNPKQQALIGDGTNPLNPSLVLPNNVQADLVTMGKLIVTLPASCAIGDFVIYDNTTGALSTITPSTPLPSGKTFANAIVDYFTPGASGAQLAVIAINPTYVIPQPA